MPPLKYHVLKEYANGVMDEKGRFFPFRGHTSGSTIAAREGIRYYVHKITMTGANAGAHASAVNGVTGTVFNEATYLAYVPNCETFAASGTNPTVCVSVGILCDLNTALTISLDANSFLTIVYAEVHEKEGEYLG